MLNLFATGWRRPYNDAPCDICMQSFKPSCSYDGREHHTDHDRRGTTDSTHVRPDHTSAVLPQLESSIYQQKLLTPYQDDMRDDEITPHHIIEHDFEDHENRFDINKDEQSNLVSQDSGAGSHADEQHVEVTECIKCSRSHSDTNISPRRKHINLIDSCSHARSSDTCNKLLTTVKTDEPTDPVPAVI